MDKRSLRRLNRKRNRFAHRGLALAPVALPSHNSTQPASAKNNYRLTVPVGAGIVLSALLYFTLPTIEQFLETSAPVLKQSSITLLMSATLVFFISGVIKGIGGIGMALISVPILSLIYSPSVAIALVSVPLVATNVWQGLLAGNVQRTLLNFHPLVITMTVAMLISAYYSTLLPATLFSISLGVVAISFALINLGLKIPSVPPKRDFLFQIITGICAGIAGGLSGLVIIPLLIYMISRQIHKEKCVQALGILFLISGVVLILAYGMNGTLTNSLFLVSCLASVPALVGVFAGEKIRHRINDVTFRRFVLYVILLIGAKILWHAAV